MSYERFAPGFFLGSSGDDGEHLREPTGWPYSIYRRDDNIGGCDVVLCHGIQSLDDAKQLLALCNGVIRPPIESPLQLFYN